MSLANVHCLSLTAHSPDFFSKLPLDVLGALREDFLSSVAKTIQSYKNEDKVALFNALAATPSNRISSSIAETDLLDLIKTHRDVLSDAAAADNLLVAALNSLMNIPMARKALDESRVGIAVNKLSKHNDAAVSKTATSLVSKWKQMLSDMKKKGEVLRTSDDSISDTPSRKRPLEDSDGLSPTSSPLKKQRTETLSLDNNNDLSLSPTSPIEITSPLTSPPRSPSRDVVMEDALSPSSGKKPILRIRSEQERKEAKGTKKVKFVEDKKLVQERSTPRWVTLAMSSKSQKKSLSEHDMAKIAFDEAVAELKTARDDMASMPLPTWTTPTPLAIPASHFRSKPNSKMAEFQEQHNNTEFLALTLGAIPPNPTNKYLESIQNDDSKAAVIPLTEVEEEKTPKAVEATPTVTTTSLAQLLAATPQPQPTQQFDPNQSLQSQLRSTLGTTPSPPVSAPTTGIARAAEILNSSAPITSTSLAELLKAVSGTSTPTVAPVTTPAFNLPGYSVPQLSATSPLLSANASLLSSLGIYSAPPPTPAPTLDLNSILSSLLTTPAVPVQQVQPAYQQPQYQQQQQYQQQNQYFNTRGRDNSYDHRDRGGYRGGFQRGPDSYNNNRDYDNNRQDARYQSDRYEGGGRGRGSYRGDHRGGRGDYRRY